MLESLSTTQTMIAMMLFVLLIIALGQAFRWRSLEAKKLYLGHCDVALAHPQCANPGGKLDMRSMTLNGDATAFIQYEWYVARLIFVLDEALRLWPSSQWYAVAEMQLGNHSSYFASDYYAKQNSLPHYSRRMRQLIQKKRNG